ncbi:MAG: histidinol dehydrogenase [Acidobacteriota bacterium]|jgi:histidinol dehydrogenase|nr:histidinol dehydrogenase [Acidobacteriota bacterium]
MNPQKKQFRLLLEPGQSEVRRIMERRSAVNQEVEQTAAEILAAVRERGDEAVREFSRRYDGWPAESLLITPKEIQAAAKEISADLKAAIETARCNIRRFHDYCRETDEGRIQTQPGVECFQRLVAIERVGLYVPGGGHPLFSSLLMLGVPAVLAGCREVVVCTPPGTDGRIHPTILYCAGLLGIRRVFRVGGAQAIAAMAYGTDSIPRVDKIFGPGNAYVTAAKMLVTREGVAIDMPAGPSELVVAADASAHAGFVVADLLSQLEHGPDSRALLVSLDRQLLATVQKQLKSRLEAGKFSQSVKDNLGETPLLFAANRKRALEIINQYAPEHLSLAVDDPESWISGIRNAGSVFLGHWSAEAAGDYASGTNHTLPTGGWARAWSGVSVQSFQKNISFQHLTPSGLLNLADTVTVMAAAENLPLHAESVLIRRNVALALPQEKENPQSLLCARARGLQPYTSARSKSRRERMVLLDANELPSDLSGKEKLNRYPDPRQSDLTRRIAAEYAWEPQRILLGNGSDELIDILIRGFCGRRGDRVLICPPAYGMYAVSARANGVDVVEVPLGPRFSLDAQAVVRRARESNARLVFLTSPNNPTGNLLDKKSILDVVRDSQAAVVVDEAYIDFASDPGFAAASAEFSNLFVLRTFSKSWGAAGVRVGLLLGHAAVLAVLRNLQAPYNISQPNQEALTRILDFKNTRERVLRELVSEREFLSAALRQLECVDEVFPSQANFLLVRFPDGADALRFLESRGVRVRDRSDLFGCANCLRISVGTAHENRLLIKSLKLYAGGKR